VLKLSRIKEKVVSNCAFSFFFFLKDNRIRIKHGRNQDGGVKFKGILISKSADKHIASLKGSFKRM
jgi:hypothetical protein